LLLKNFGFGVRQIYPREPGNVRDIKVGIRGHDCRSRMQMADKPHHSGRQRHQKK
jgi:hypothetical protein